MYVNGFLSFFNEFNKADGKQANCILSIDFCDRQFGISIDPSAPGGGGGAGGGKDIKKILKLINYLKQNLIKVE